SPFRRSEAPALRQAHWCGATACRPAQARAPAAPSDDVVIGLLRRQRHAGGLGVESQLPRPGVLRMELIAHDARPDPAGGAVLGNLLEEVAVRVEEERDAR